MKAGIIMIVIAAVNALFSVAQAKVSYGLEAGPQFSPSFSYRAGANISFPLSSKLSIDPGLFLSMYHRTSSGTSKKNGISTEHKRAIHGQFLQLPLRLSINNTTLSGNLYKILVGPYFAYGIGGNTKLTKNREGEVTVQNASSFAESYSSRFDWGIDVEFQYYIRNHYQIGIYLLTGCKKLYTPENTAEAIFSEIFIVGKINLAFGLSLGYRF